MSHSDLCCYCMLRLGPAQRFELVLADKGLRFVWCERCASQDSAFAMATTAYARRDEDLLVSVIAVLKQRIRPPAASFTLRFADHARPAAALLGAS